MAELHIRGQVQGVGFRPCVWQLARALGLNGEVMNSGEGVIVSLFPADRRDEFVAKLRNNLPPQAQIDSITCEQTVVAKPPEDFTIAPSVASCADTHVLPDLATCSHCLDELFSSNSRFYQYPLLNCCHCGPRYSIIQAMPYDRGHTSMADFVMCKACQAEYASPDNRRFHAQPTACPTCGPQLALINTTNGTSNVTTPLADTAACLKQGGVIAIKGVGGFHLACDALNVDAVNRLRKAKKRPEKPLALMMHDLNEVGAYCQINRSEAEQLTSPAAPIVLLQSRISALPHNIAPGLDRTGVMLPSNPIQHLLMANIEGPLVMTSANLSGEPPATSLNELTKLIELTEIDRDQTSGLFGGIDAIHTHNRHIVRRVDDSVVQCTGSGVQILRRARGYAPAPIKLPRGFDQCHGVLALGGDLKNAAAISRHGFVYISAYLGDLEPLSVQRQCRASIDDLRQLFTSDLSHICCDTHPGYISRELACELAGATGCEITEVQHHHAHLAACLAEHQIPLDENKVLGLILDGTGAAPANSPHPIWGGEFLLGNYREFEHLGGLPAVPLPGAEKATKHPWRNLLAHLESFSPHWREFSLPAFTALKQHPIEPLCAAIRQEINSPKASSCGRLFDAVAALTGCAPTVQSYEGQAAMGLQNSAEKALNSGCQITMDNSPEWDFKTLWHNLITDMVQHQDPNRTALYFHLQFSAMLSQQLLQLAKKHQVTTIALSGGCWQNRLLLDLVVDQLQQHKMQVMSPHQYPCNDGGLALGQIAIGWAARAASAG
ncbi:carbamoyltransferase HypF [Corallincola platygyrae]|uniref:Carbamoyltransferase HypF n=2 Tax=Corallincola platygyrae TaxID=1193278 RepID=A0ABW4XI99_9GAMM